MLAFVADRATDRKLRLFSCCCARQVWGLLPHAWSRRSLEAVEQYLEGAVTAAEAAEAWRQEQEGHRAIAESDSIQNRTEVAPWATLAVNWAALPLNPQEPDNERIDTRRRPRVAAVEAARYVGMVESMELYRTQRRWDEALSQRMCKRLCDLVRDFFGPLPFRQVPIDPRLLNWDGGIVVRLARAAYDERKLPEGTLVPLHLAVLADALLDAGCTNEECLGHLRGPGPHVRGCWAIDLLLARG
jgi:hypothetical protein